MAHSGALHIFERRRGPKRREAWGKLPLPRPFNEPAQTYAENFFEKLSLVRVAKNATFF